MTEKLWERMRKFRLSPWKPSPPDTVEEAEAMWAGSMALFESEVKVLEGKLLAYEQREDGKELCEAHEGHWHPIEEMYTDSEGVWLCRGAWDELVNATIDEVGEAGGVQYERG